MSKVTAKTNSSQLLLDQNSSVLFKPKGEQTSFDDSHDFVERKEIQTSDNTKSALVLQNSLNNESAVDSVNNSLSAIKLQCIVDSSSERVNTLSTATNITKETCAKTSSFSAPQTTDDHSEIASDTICLRPGGFTNMSSRVGRGAKWGSRFDNASASKAGGDKTAVDGSRGRGGRRGNARKTGKREERPMDAEHKKIGQSSAQHRSSNSGSNQQFSPRKDTQQEEDDDEVKKSISLMQ